MMVNWNQNQMTGKEEFTELLFKEIFKEAVTEQRNFGDEAL